MALQTKDVIDLMESSTNIKLTSLKVDGGASAHSLLMQIQADILGSFIDRPECIETTALGAAYLAGLSLGVYTSLDDIKKNRRKGKTFTPETDDEWREQKLKIWHKAVKRSLDFAE